MLPSVSMRPVNWAVSDRFQRIYPAVPPQTWSCPKCQSDLSQLEANRVTCAQTNHGKQVGMTSWITLL